MLLSSDLNLACSRFLLARRQEATSQRLQVRHNASQVDVKVSPSLELFFDTSQYCVVKTDGTLTGKDQNIQPDTYWDCFQSVPGTNTRTN